MTVPTFDHFIFTKMVISYGSMSIVYVVPSFHKDIINTTLNKQLIGLLKVSKQYKIQR